MHIRYLTIIYFENVFHNSSSDLKKKLAAQQFERMLHIEVHEYIVDRNKSKVNENEKSMNRRVFGHEAF